MCTSLNQTLSAPRTRNTSHRISRPSLPKERTIFTIENRPTNSYDAANWFLVRYANGVTTCNFGLEGVSQIPADSMGKNQIEKTSSSPIIRRTFKQDALLRKVCPRGTLMVM